MGHLVYDGAAEYEIEDRMLAHLKAAVGIKLRRQECFFISWANPVERGSGRISVWVSPHIPLVFRFSGSRPPELNPAWIDVMNRLANTPRGLIMISEQDAERIAA
ncbi:hypothetical protein JD276_02155 [Leucobacter sp. CSA1]|uniref:DUF7882 domain-containing protein n=1 Tax=Leucobacter chromiisoli TaxID=2796471 RepID=A0A934Q5P4_9MICO|nr:hypothetical protein [Leucobacter chromiisoli]MBK0417838.1 hypothetical protein [Leucobacter chromiisoli]